MKPLEGEAPAPSHKLLPVKTVKHGFTGHVMLYCSSRPSDVRETGTVSRQDLKARLLIAMIDFFRTAVAKSFALFSCPHPLSLSKFGEGIKEGTLGNCHKQGPGENEWIETLGDDCVSLEDVRLISDRLGRPQVFVRGSIGPPVSFSHSCGRTWAAMSLNGGSAGIDAAAVSEFPDDYPFHRAFGNEELRFIVERFRVPLAEAAALAWSAKEAVVKALGCGFRLVDPLDLHVVPRGGGHDDGTGFVEVDLLRRARARFSPIRGSTKTVAVFRENGIRLSVTPA